VQSQLEDGSKNEAESWDSVRSEHFVGKSRLRVGGRWRYGDESAC
jgi:hypothetical protein